VIGSRHFNGREAGATTVIRVRALLRERRLQAHRCSDVVLISRENFILFTPMLHEVAAGDLQPSDIVNPLRRILRHVKVVEADVEAIDLRAKKVSCVGGIRDVRREFEFDQLSETLSEAPCPKTPKDADRVGGHPLDFSGEYGRPSAISLRCQSRGRGFKSVEPAIKSQS
jgi:hypothetical protein